MSDHTRAARRANHSMRDDRTLGPGRLEGWSPRKRFLTSVRLPATFVPCVAMQLLLLVVMASGCAQWDTKSKAKWPWQKEKNKPAEVAQIVPMWSDTVLYEAGKPGIRGFGARVYFYGEEAKKPVAVKGDIIVYAFDANDETRMPVPEKKFVFTAEHLEKHFSKTQLGPSYSLWIPWDEVGGAPRQLSLVTRYEGADGAVVVSEPARKLLPGVPEEAREGALAKDASGKKTADGKVVPASFESETEANGEAAPTSRAALTVDLPPSFSRKLRGKPTEPSAGADRTSGDGDVEERRDSSSDEAGNSAADAAGWWGPESTDGASTEPSGKESEEAVESLPTTDRLSAHFAQRRYQARTPRGVSPTPVPPRRRPHRGGWLSGLPPTPRSEDPASAPAP